jgi:pimeloyl-ACP methyl ester carboxylesterase
VKYFAADVDPARASIMYAIQQPLSMDALKDTMGKPAWKALPSWYMVAKNDQVIPPDVERMFARRMGATVVEIESSHVPMVSHPDAVVSLIVKAAGSVR